ncbi:hypothetical protein AAFF_G00043060 [Aldrovandia affinis]|uniref:Ig-like domain-containing protein n=1 Tax=Aldrovandia affinis TaxID=143900 RepID=A0AAD7WF14_9TELE|nr:hypothetical protein AAFF_G00043060 [Aldrovandia affinis]
MDGIWLFFILLPEFGGVILQVQLEPKNATVYRGREARFNCSLGQPDWVIMTWSLKGSLVLTISKEFGAITNNDRFTAENHTSDQSYMWEFFIKSAQRNDSGEVICDVQNIGRNVATLSVQESGTVAIPGGNVTAMEKQQVTFYCLALEWFPEPLVTWTMDGIAVDNHNISTVAFEGWFNSTSTLTILANYSVTIECQATVLTLPVPKTSSVFLTVAAEPDEKDQTVLIAVTVSVVAVVLLVLIIIVLSVFYCKRRRVTASTAFRQRTRQIQL